MTAALAQTQMAKTRVSIRTISWWWIWCVALAAPLATASKVDHEAECTYKQLGWDDFRGPIMNGQQVAWIMATIVLDPVRIEMADEEGGGAVARVRNPAAYALMNKLQSGAQRGGRTDRNLRHEQIHFDLAEFLARRLSRELREMTLEGPAASQELQRDLLLAVQNRFSETLIELQHLQAQYDGETSHGRKAGAQREWAEKAAELLGSEPPYELK
jgi:hypothetical protein